MPRNHDDSDAGLPDIEGGWDLTTFSFTGDESVQLWVPRRPDSLLDDEAVQERNRFNDSMPYWAWMWESAPTMADLVVQQSVRGRVLELGAGLGLVGIAVAKIALSRVELTLSDYDPLSVAALRVNADRNGLASAAVWELDWRNVDAHSAEPFDVLIGCDVIYEAQAHAPLLDVIDRLMAKDGGRALIADPGRTRLPQFMKRARERGFDVVLTDESGEGAEPEIGAFRLVTLTVA